MSRTVPHQPTSEQLLFTSLRQANAEAVLYALEARERLSPETTKGIGYCCGLTPEQVEVALEDLARAGRIRLEVVGAHRYVCRVGEEAVAA
jgi:hypothetical protein